MAHRNIAFIAATADSPPPPDDKTELEPDDGTGFAP